MFENLNLGIYFLVFGGKLLESTIGTFRMMVVNNGMKKLGAILQFVLVMNWLYITSVALVNLQDDILTVFVYALGGSVGTYVGVLLEQKLAIGSNLIVAITDHFNGERIANEIRNDNIAVTELEGKGKVDNKKILFIVNKRRTKKKLIKKIKTMDKNVMILTDTLSDVSGGIVS